MASNPIQKKVRNAMLIGVLITVLIMGSIVAYLLMQMNKLNEEKQALIDATVSVYKLAENLESGDILTEDMLVKGLTKEEYIPSNAIITKAELDQFKNYSLSDREGNRVYTDEIGLYLLKDCEYTEIYIEENDEDEEDETKYYTYSPEGEKVTITFDSSEIIYTDYNEVNNNTDDEKYILQEAKSKTRLYYDESLGEYYIYKIRYQANRNQDHVREREYIDILGTPYIAKIDIKENTIITSDMLAFGELLTDDIRKQEYNAVILPADLTTGDYIDIRVMLPNGQDFVVVSKKMVEIPMINGMDSENTIWVEMAEDEILTMACAMVDAYRIDGSKLYATKYVDPGFQEAAEVTYPISAETELLIKADPNITEEAETALLRRYTDALKIIRNETINKELEKEENSMSNATSGINESIVHSQEERKKYLQSIANGY